MIYKLGTRRLHQQKINRPKKWHVNRKLFKLPSDTFVPIYISVSSPWLLTHHISSASILELRFIKHWILAIEEKSTIAYKNKDYEVFREMIKWTETHYLRQNKLAKEYIKVDRKKEGTTNFYEITVNLKKVDVKNKIQQGKKTCYEETLNCLAKQMQIANGRR